MSLYRLFSTSYLINRIWCAQPNPPTWPTGVYVLDPSDSTTAQSEIDAAFSTNGGHDPVNNGQWSTDHYAFLFMPGTHNVSMNVGYYTTVHGMGMTPQDTSIAAITVENGDFDYTVGALDNFWRSAENFENTPISDWNNQNTPSLLWAVSQSSPLRRVQINGDLSLYQYNSGSAAGYASGGFMADVIVTGDIYPGSQQQFLHRNIEMASYVSGVWNMVFVGCTGTLPTNANGDCYPFTEVLTTPIIAEKPFIYYNNSKYSIIVPQVETNKSGPATNWGKNYDTIDFTDVYVSSPSDTVDTINSMLLSGLSVVMGPGIYNLSTSIQITKSNTVLLGLGLPVLECGIGSGDPCIQVLDGVTGVRIGGFLLQASNMEYNTSSLLQMGSTATKDTIKYQEIEKRRIRKNNKYKQNNLRYNKNNQNIHKNSMKYFENKFSKKYQLYSKSKLQATTYNFIYDVYGRVGGMNNPSIYQVSTDTIFDINMDNTIIDGTWLWRADHDITGSVYNSNNPVNNGIIVNGDNVITYGLASEHTLGNLVEWYGNNGQVYFYQSEYPYDVTQSNYGDPGYVSYLVDDSVTNHNAYGIGVYSYFRDNDVTVENGVKSSSTSSFTTVFTKYLTGNGGISHIINDQGSAVNSNNGIAYQCTYPGDGKIVNDTLVGRK